MAKDSADVFWKTLAVIAVTCLVVLTAIVVRRQFSGSSNESLQSEQAALRPPEPVDDWPRVAGAGHRIGPPNAPVTIVVFSDFECPYCARFATQIFPQLQSRFPDQLALVFRHWPLRRHASAYPAARAAECAAVQGRFEAFHNLLFSQQHLLPIKPFRQFAFEAGLKDLAAFDACTNSNAPVAAIEADITEVRRLGATGTPTLVINGLLVRAPYSGAILASHIQSALDRTSR
jgi:protein-disulfide isomerase